VKKILGLVVALAGCGSSGLDSNDSLSCGPGTVQVDSQCVVAPADDLGSSNGFFTNDLAYAPDDLAYGSSDLAYGSSDLGVPSTSELAAFCAGSSNVIYFHGDTTDYVYPGIETLTQGAWSAQSATGTMPSDVTISVTPTDPSQGLWWDLEFSSTQLDAPLAVMTYTDAERAPFADPGHPGIDIGGDGRGCNMDSGQFSVLAISTQGNTLKTFTATFEQHCEDGTSALRGCVHFQQ
jgi:hypothetical protein